MAMILQPTRLRLTQAIYFGHPPGGGTGTVTAVGGGNGITATPGPIVAAGVLDLGPLTADWTAWAGTALGPHYDIEARNVGRIYNVKAYGALGNSIANDAPAIQAAVNDAIATRGTVYFPRTNGYYRIGATINVQDANGLNIVGEGSRASQIGPHVSAPNITLLKIVGTGGSGSVNNIVIRDIGLTADPTGIAIEILDCLHFSLENVYLLAGAPSLSIQGSGNGTLVNVQAYGGLNVGNGGGILTNSGPLEFTGCQFQTSASATPAAVLSGDLLGVKFNTTQFQCDGGTHAATVQIDGGLGTIGSVEFHYCHGESNYNNTNTAVDFLIGSVTKFAHVGFYGGNYWGHGNGVNYQDMWLKIVAAKSIVVEGVIVSKLIFANGYNSGVIRLESTFPAAGDTYRFAENNKDTVTGPLYSDANGLIAATYTGSAATPAEFSGGTTANAVVIRAASKATVGPTIRMDNEDATSNYSALRWAGRGVDKWSLIGDLNLTGAQTFALNDEVNAKQPLRIEGNLAGGFTGIGSVQPTRTLDVNGVERLRGIAAPPVSEANSGTIYFDSASNRLMASLNGSAYVPVIGSGGVTGSGTAGQVAYWDNVTDLASPSGIYIDAVNNRIGIATALPAYSLDVGSDVNVDNGGYRNFGQIALFMDTFNSSVFVASGGSVVPAVGFGSTLVGFTSGVSATGTALTAIGSQVFPNASGNENTGIGASALFATTSGADNTAIGYLAGATNTTGGGNIFIGAGADAAAGNLTNAAAIGTGAVVADSNCLFIGGGITKVGLGVSTPKHNLDVAGAVGMHQTVVTLVNGLNSDIVLPTEASWARIIGPTGGFSVGGFDTPLGVSDGLILAIYNTVAQQMTIVNEDLASTAIFRIKTLTGGDVVLRAGTSAATFRYDAFDDRWILMSSN